MSTFVTFAEAFTSGLSGSKRVLEAREKGVREEALRTHFDEKPRAHFDEKPRAHFDEKPRAHRGVRPLAGNPIASGILETAEELGVDPVDLATVISYETAGTFDPEISGPTTQWGTHRGLIQWGEPQAQQFGVDWTDPIGSQLGRSGAVVRYMRNAGVKPGTSLLDLYSAVNAGRVGRHGARDAAAGGMPGTVAEKVEGMEPHRLNAMKLLGLDQGF